ncbi:hypothetical protein DFJ73DRAFT_800841 [Zopfochytrium polystomum]|nr:hypothetical protein DFJ73DRAFT_800841 [Zopfochytrium polystomum]
MNLIAALAAAAAVAVATTTSPIAAAPAPAPDAAADALQNLADVIHNTADATTVFTPVALAPPLNYLAASKLIPRIIAGYNADIAAYNATGWANHVLDQCRTYKLCTAALSFQAQNSGSTGGQYWFGYVYKGGAVTAADFERDDDPVDNVKDSYAFTVKA